MLGVVISIGVAVLFLFRRPIVNVTVVVVVVVVVVRAIVVIIIDNY